MPAAWKVVRPLPTKKSNAALSFANAVVESCSSLSRVGSETHAAHRRATRTRRTAPLRATRRPARATAFQLVARRGSHTTIRGCSVGFAVAASAFPTGARLPFWHRRRLPRRGAGQLALARTWPLSCSSPAHDPLVPNAGSRAPHHTADAHRQAAPRPGDPG